jgi:colicin import membrane protein
MPASTERFEFAPPPQPGLVRAFVLAVIAHVLLMLALTWGIHWNRENENISAEAELWSATPQEAAPKLVEAPPPPPPPPPVERRVEAPPPPPAPVAKEADISVEREKKKQELAKLRQQELAKLRQQELAKLHQQELEKKKLEAKHKQEELKREQLAQKKEAEEHRKKEEQLKAAKGKEQDKKLAALRTEQLRRIQGLANATGGEESRGTALKSSGPSDSYAGRIRARVRPNVVFTDDVSGNPTAEVEVRMAPDGTIVSTKITKSSGLRSWDEAVLRALDKTEVLPRDVDGRVHTPLIIAFRPKD